MRATRCTKVEGEPGSLGLVWGVMDRETLDQLLRAEMLALLAQQAEVIRRQRDEQEPPASANQRPERTHRQTEQEEPQPGKHQRHHGIPLVRIAGADRSRSTPGRL